MGLAGETPRALLRAWQRMRTFVQLAIVAVIVAAPAPVLMTAPRAEPADPQDLVAADHPLVTPAPPPEPVARAAPVARGTPPAPEGPPVAAPVGAGGRLVWASWYGPGFYGNRTACGQTFTQSSWGVAHPSLPCGTSLAITYAGRTVVAPVIDRGPYVAGRELDLAEAVARSLGFTGVQQVRLEIR